MDRVIPQFPFYILFLFPVTVPYGTKPVDRTQRSVESGSLLLVYRCRRVQFFVYMKKHSPKRVPGMPKKPVLKGDALYRRASP